MFYLVKNPKWANALIAIHSEPGDIWESYANHGYISKTIAEQMVTAGIAKYDEPPNVRDHRAGPDQPAQSTTDTVAGSGASTCWATLPNCPDCAVSPGSIHKPWCGIERCPACGWQRLSCDCRTKLEPLPWTGVAECWEDISNQEKQS